GRSATDDRDHPAPRAGRDRREHLSRGTNARAAAVPAAGACGHPARGRCRPGGVARSVRRRDRRAQRSLPEIAAVVLAVHHELRRGELARLGEVPHHPYYGSVDATPLFALVFAETVKWTADRALWRDLLPAAERALTWCDTYGDPDKDGYVEYGHRPGEMRS